MPPGFWPRLLAHHSLREATALRAPLPQPLLTADELFALLVRAADSIRAGTPRELRLYLGDQKMVWRQTSEQLGTAYPTLLPRSADRTLAGYAERLRVRHGHPCFAIMLNECQTLSADVWSRVRDFVAGLVTEAGFPLGGVDANLFAGNYRRTPFGVHTDDRDVFTWIAQGKKRFLVWPWQELAPLMNGAEGEGAAAPRHPHDYADQRKRAQRLEGVAGDLLYWPREYWHVAEAGAGELSATLSIGLSSRLPAQAWARELLGGLGALAVGPPPAAPGRRSPAQVPGGRPPAHRLARAPAVRRQRPEELPPDLTRLAAAVAEGSLARRFERELRLRWMCWTTGFGLRTPAREPARPPELEDLVRGDPRWPIARTQRDGQLLCAANGYGLAVPTWKEAESFFAQLDSGEPILVRDLYSSLSQNMDLAQLRALLAALLSCRAIAYVARRAPRRGRSLPDPVKRERVNPPRRRKKR